MIRLAGCRHPVVTAAFSTDGGPLATMGNDGNGCEVLLWGATVSE